MLEFLTTTSYSFEDKKSYENVILFLSRHWFVLFIKLLGLVFLGLLPVVLTIALNMVLSVSSEAKSLLNLLYAIFYLFWWYAFFYQITMYLLDYWIVTDHRIIDSQQYGFFNRSIAELSLAKIQDVSVDVVGFFPTWLDYGNLEVQSAGASEKFFFKQIPHPTHVKDTIMDAHNEFVRIHIDGVEVHEP